MDTVKGIMIGDWLDYFDTNDGRNHPSRVIGITQDGYCGESLKIVPHYDPGDELDANIKWFFPIHITRDILESNGITLLEIGDHGVLTPPEHRDRYERWMICDASHRKAFLYHDRVTGLWHINGLEGYTILYVHQLQHALQAIFMEKDITIKQVA